MLSHKLCYSNEHNIKVLETRIGLNINLHQGMGGSLSDIDFKKKKRVLFYNHFAEFNEWLDHD